MILRFNGMYSKVKSGGCPCHGGGGNSKTTFMLRRSLQLPSGKYITFHYGETYNVTEEDGHFLLSYTYTDKDGMTFHSFTEEK